MKTPLVLVFENEKGEIVGERMTYEKLSSKMPPDAKTRWRCNYCLVEGTQAELAAVACAAGAKHPRMA